MSQHRPARNAWLGRLSTYIVSFAWGLTVAYGRLEYRGLAGAVALSGVLAAAVWIRGLGARAGVARYAPPLLLVPAGCAAGIAAFSSGPAVSIFTAAAAVLTVGAVLVAKELRSAAMLLLGAPFIALGAPFIVVGAAIMANRAVLDGAAVIAVGAAVITVGVALSAGRATLARAGVITVGAGVIAG